MKKVMARIDDNISETDEVSRITFFKEKMVPGLFYEVDIFGVECLVRCEGGAICFYRKDGGPGS